TMREDGRRRRAAKLAELSKQLKRKREKDEDDEDQQQEKEKEERHNTTQVDATEESKSWGPLAQNQLLDGREIWQFVDKTISDHPELSSSEASRSDKTRTPDGACGNTRMTEATV